MPRLFLVTGADVVERPGFVEIATAALVAGGCGCALQLRGHGLNGCRLWQLARDLRPAADAAGAMLWINDRVDVAVSTRAHGVQLGRRSMPISEARRLLGAAVWIGASVHSPGEAAGAISAGADVAVLGNVYETASHPERAALGREALRQASFGGRPIVAIGGISPERVSEVMESGAWGVAVLSGIWGAGDVAAEVRRYRQALAEAPD
ncbi:MAG: thiamine phosphate synthase [Gemmatimonadota bacterium]|nr:MAG: thiamine phosphate synthase [Gemmatimonadota bacterium]